MLDWSQCSAVERQPDQESGAWVFRGTRVPVAALFENLESGARLEEFLAWFPVVTREQAEAVLDHLALEPLPEDDLKGRGLTAEEIAASSEIGAWAEDEMQSGAEYVEQRRHARLERPSKEA